jgi:hypothetical protein
VDVTAGDHTDPYMQSNKFKRNYYFELTVYFIDSNYQLSASNLNVILEKTFILISDEG